MPMSCSCEDLVIEIEIIADDLIVCVLEYGMSCICVYECERGGTENMQVQG